MPAKIADWGFGKLVLITSLNFSLTELQGVKLLAELWKEFNFFGGEFKKINEQIKILPIKQRQEIKKILD
ncbi:MAG: hypothetical protein PHY72_01455 [Candidatus Pacebacteria bacterium]|nr:hypothetical protein [Candidatus Paceibacterota bacterium]